MAHPEWVLKHKLPSTEIRCIKGKYYLYNYTSVWCPEKKRAKKKTLNQVGVITEEYGLIPTGMSRKGKVPAGASKMKVDAKSETSFLDSFEKINDIRSERNKLYSVVEILLVTLLAVICGAEGWQDVENYGKSKIDYLKTYFDFTNGIPSDDTFRRFFRSIDPELFQNIFREWVQNLVKAVNAKVIAIDGKSSRRSYDDDGNMLHMVSAFATEARIVLGQEKVADKSNEITAIPKLLELLDIKNHIVTIDAMGCQYEIANKIIKKEGDYVFSLKGNQGNLSSDVTLYFEGIDAKKKSESYTHYDKGHGRIETRECVVSNDVEWLTSTHPKWQSIKSIVRVNSTREIKGKVTQEARYYVSSLDISAMEMLSAIRSHWAIENSLHWVLDMSFNEDYSRIRKENAPQVMAIIRHIALNILQQNRLPRQSIKGTRKLCAWNDATLTELLAKFTSS
jgi:predicted transposase YbfD/YdcC